MKKIFYILAMLPVIGIITYTLFFDTLAFLVGVGIIAISFIFTWGLAGLLNSEKGTA